MDKYLYQKTTTKNAYPLNREAINGKITGLKSTKMPCFVSIPVHLHSSLPFFFSLPFCRPCVIISGTAKLLPNPPPPNLLQLLPWLARLQGSLTKHLSYVFTCKVLLIRSVTSTVSRLANCITSLMCRLGYQNITYSHCQCFCCMTLQTTPLFLKAANYHLHEKQIT